MDGWREGGRREEGGGEGGVRRVTTTTTRGSWGERAPHVSLSLSGERGGENRSKRDREKKRAREERGRERGGEQEQERERERTCAREERAPERERKGA